MEHLMQGKIVMVTGSTSGIGFVAARELARLGAKVVLVSRNSIKCAEAVEKIQQETGNQQIESIAADLSTRNGVRLAADTFLQKYAQLDVLLNNAGAMFMSREVSSDGIEMTFALNHLNYFYLTSLLLDALKAGAQARIVNVSSDAHRGGKINFDDIHSKNSYSGFGAYAQSKLANVLFTYELARKLEGLTVTCNALHPGFVDTGFGKNNGGFMKAAMGLLKPFQKKVDEGARTSIYLASAPDVDHVTGKYFADCKDTRSDPISYDRKTAERLWQLSLDLLS